MLWLLHDDALRQLREMEKRVTLDAQQQQAWVEHAEHEATDRGPRSLRVAGEIAEIRVEGLLTKQPDFWARLFGFGNTSYADLLEAIAVARSNPDVKAVQVFVDSPGGTADGFFEVLAAFEQLRAEKQVRVRAANAYSAAYGIASVAGPITASTPASMFGSVGVAVRYARWADVEVYDITNTESPDKRPDPATAEGQAVIRRELDAVFDLFAEAIARGRSASTGETVTRAEVAENFGRGASFVAKDAKRRGMIDTVPKASARPALRVVSEAEPSAARGQESKMSETTKKLTIEDLRAQQPELYAAVLQEGAAQGVTQERDRVCAHLEMAEMSGKPDASSGLHIAVEAIRTGADVTKTLMAKYMAAGMNRRDRTERQAETDAAGAAADGAQPAPAASDDATFSQAVLAELEKRRGKKSS